MRACRGTVWGKMALVAAACLLVGLGEPAAPPSGAARGRTADPQGATVLLVVLAEQADLAPAYSMRDWEARGRFVWEALRETAGRTQPAVLMAVNGLQAAGHVGAVKSHYAVNAIVVRGDAVAARSLAARPDVAAVLPDRPIIPVLPVAADSAGALAPEWNISRIRADQVWATYGITGSGVVVANIDSGVQYTHPALVRQYRGNLGGGSFDHNYNWWDPTGEHLYPQPIAGLYPLGSSHGTHTMGVIVGDDGAGNQVGVAPGARWIAAYGFSDVDGLLSAMEWMLAPTDLAGNNPDPGKRPHVVSNSWGAPGAMVLWNPLLEAQRAAGIFGAWAAGNNGMNGCGTLVSPADGPAGFAVGATDQSDGIAFFSSRGPNATRRWLDTYGTGPEVTAPGYPIRTSTPGGGYTISGGTSFATPHVAGTVALLWSAEPDLIGRVEETAAILRGTAVPKTTGEMCGGVPGSAVPNNTYGWGRIDALAAVEMVWHAGTLAGTVHDAVTGAPVAAEVRMQRSGYALLTAAGPAGAYNFPLGQGSYTVTVQAYGYVSQTVSGVDVVQDMTTTLDVALAPRPGHTLAGTAQSGLPSHPPDPVPADLGLRGTPVLAAADPYSGAYSVTVAAGSYRLRAIARGYEPVEQAITVTGDLSVNLELAPRPTYYVRDSRSVCGPAFDWLDATGGAPYGGFKFMEFRQTDDPLHPFPFYGALKSSYFVSSMGFVGFSAGHPQHSQDTPTTWLPFEGPPNDAVYAFLDVLDPAENTQGVVYYDVLDERYVVIEFYQVQHWGGGAPETFEFVFDTATGVITLQYLEVSRPDWSTVGLEDAAGADGLLYSYMDSAGLTDSLAVAFYPIFGPPPADQEPGGVWGALSGTVYLSGTTIPVPGAVVSAESYLQTLTATADAAGRYLFPAVCADLYTLEAAALGYRAGGSAEARLRWAGDVAVNDLFLGALQAEPALTKTVWPAQVRYGGLLTYTLAYANHGEGHLLGAVLSDTLPGVVGYITSTPPGVYRDGVLTWTVDLPPGGSGAATIMGYLIPPPCPAGVLTATLTNTACLFWAGPAISSGAVFEALPLPAPEPVMTKTVWPAAVRPGALLTYTIALANPGAGDLGAALLSDAIPDVVDYITSTPPGLLQGRTLVWYPEVPAGESMAVTIVGQLTSTAAPGTLITNTAELTGCGVDVSSTVPFQVAAPPYRVYLPLVFRKGP